MKNKYLTGLLTISLLGFAGSLRLLADDQPAPGVARISVIRGDVSTQRGDSGDWVATTVNAPLAQGDKIATGDRSRAEVQLDYANVLRLDQRAAVNIATLTRASILLQVAQGTVTVSVLRGAEAAMEIDTPNMSVRPLAEGSYRIQVNPPSDSQVTARVGRAEVATAQGSATVEENQTMYIRGTDNPEYRIANADPNDEWDNWNRDRDQAIMQAQSWNHTNQYYTGANDLDNYGQWVDVPGYDWCWTPYVDMGWVPYRDGRWIWEPYYGWTWVSYEPWGWAPYHYGRWFLWHNTWRWWPGFVGPGYYPLWAPAWVSFMGFGFGGLHWGFGFGFGFGSIGWLALGPGDHFYPWWGPGHSYNVVNITHITNINNINPGRFGPNPVRPLASNFEAALTNERVRGAITTVSAEDFANGRIPRNPRAIDANTLRQASVVNGTLPVVPNRQSLQSVDRPVNRASLPRAAASGERFFSRGAAPARPASFAQQASAVQRMVQTHSSLATAGAGAAGTNRAGVNRPMGRATPEGNAGRTAGERPSWGGFSSGRSAPSAGAGSAPRASTGSAGDRWPKTFNMPGSSGRESAAPEATPARPTHDQGGWDRYTTRPQAAPASSAPRSAGAGSVWDRFASRPAPAWSGASRSYGRPPLDLSKPIVTQRSAPNASGGGGRGSSAPSGGERGNSAPSGGGHGGSGSHGGGHPGGRH